MNVLGVVAVALALAAWATGKAGAAEPAVQPEVQPQVPVASTRIAALSAAELESPAAAALRKLPKEFVNSPKARRFSLAAQRDEDTASARPPEEFIVRAERDPEDVLRKKSGMQNLRERLERDRPMTLAEKSKLALCFIGLCADYGPDGAPHEDKTFSRSEQAAKRSTLEMTQQFRGTYQ